MKMLAIIILAVSAIGCSGGSTEKFSYYEPPKIAPTPNTNYKGMTLAEALKSRDAKVSKVKNVLVIKQQN